MKIELYPFINIDGNRGMYVMVNGRIIGTYENDDYGRLMICSTWSTQDDQYYVFYPTSRRKAKMICMILNRRMLSERKFELRHAQQAET